jgi:predicted phage baseplate assembly protein
VRNTIAYVQSEQLTLVDLPILEPLQVGATGLMLDRMVLGLQTGGAIILTGEDADSVGVIRNEVLFLKEITHANGFTILEFQTGLQYGYVRQSATINANVALATHGETKSQVLGSGDASQPLQSFLLKEAPLTYIASSRPSGAESTLKVPVNEIKWEEVPSLFGLGPRDRAYAVRIGDDGKATVQFGDGESGARPSTGIENIAATYRVGIGLAGMVKAGQLSLLMTRPLGVKSVINPLPADGAADPENLEEARVNAPFTVLTLDRIVSLQDFEDFARAFAGIGKSQATWLWDGERRVVHITVAAANGNTVSENSNLFINLRNAIDAARDPIQHIIVQTYQPRAFNVEAKILVLPGYDKEKVKAWVIVALGQAFGFAVRNFGQGVTKSDVLAMIQAVEGVQAVDLDKLYIAGQTSELKERLLANIAHWDTSVSHPEIQLAELLTINPAGILLTDMTLT